MDFAYSPDQQLLRESLARLLTDRYDFEARKRILLAGSMSRDIWSCFADMGLLSLPFPESDGGLCGGAVEMSIVMEAFGRHLVLEPYLASIILGGGCLRYGASAEQRQHLVPRIIDGSSILALAHVERGARFELAHVATTANRDGEGWRLDGAKHYVLHGQSADALVVSARISGAARDPQGLALFLVDSSAAGLERRGYVTQDGTLAADLRFSGVRVEGSALIGEPGEALPLIERVVGDALAALCAEAVGAMARALEITVEYLKIRKQFGVPIGSFQALQHRAVDMLVLVEQARSMALYAAMMSGEPDVEERARALSAARYLVGRAGRFVGEQAVQLHGGIGMTEECQVGHYYRRLTMLELLFGDSHHHLRLLARQR
ncbi:MAG TPA: acyl-CoA dehydrogenase family protein [Steroidobacteraceae bacterium]|nr:acyl-CoA dehydrogenase family protein [Steroidobacteraceae bacterium]